MYDSATDHPRYKGTHQVGHLSRFWAKDDTDGVTMPSAYDRSTTRKAIQEGLADYAAEQTERSWAMMADHEREVHLAGRDRTREARELAWEFEDRAVRVKRGPRRAPVRMAAEIDLEERAMRRDAVIHFAGLSSKRRAAKRRPALTGAPFDPALVSRTLSPAFAEKASA